jgi:hypothetical protein
VLGGAEIRSEQVLARHIFHLTVMDLNDVHKGAVQRYSLFFKGKRERMLADRNTDKEEFKSDRIDTTAVYSGADVEELLEQYHATMMGTLRQELEQLLDFSAVYVSQVFSQVQQYGMTLEGIDVSLIEDQNRVAALRALDGGSAPPLDRNPSHKLAPVGTQGTVDLALHSQVQELQESNRVMEERYQRMQVEAQSLLQERSTLRGELEKVKENFAMLRQQMHASGLDSASSSHVQEIENSLGETRGLLDAKNAEVAKMSHELQQRLGDSSQFRELKAIVKKKSEEVKMLRRAMVASGLEPPAMAGGIDLVADDD